MNKPLLVVAIQAYRSCLGILRLGKAYGEECLEATVRENRCLSNRLRRARLKHNAALKDIDYRHPRGLNKSLIQSLAAYRWVTEHLNILITGPTGVGKTWLPVLWRKRACREGHSSLYLRLLLQEMAIAKGDGRYPRLLTTLAKTEVLILGLCVANSYVELSLNRPDQGSRQDAQGTSMGNIERNCPEGKQWACRRPQ